MRFWSAVLFAVLTCGSAVATPYEDGVANRYAWETWSRTLNGDAAEGAQFWAAQRSLTNPQPCTDPSKSIQWREGCWEALQRLAVPDIRRRAEPDYRRGWNAPISAQGTAPPTHAPPQQTQQSLAAPASETSIPLYDVDAACRTSSLPARCIRDEQDAYNYLRRVWSGLPESTRRFAVSQVRNISAHKYQIVVRYVNALQERDRELARQSGSPSFRP